MSKGDGYGRIGSFQGAHVCAKSPIRIQLSQPYEGIFTGKGKEHQSAFLLSQKSPSKTLAKGFIQGRQLFLLKRE